MRYSRRELGKYALSALPAAHLLARRWNVSADETMAKPASNFELEYPVPDGSDVMNELKKCVEFCKEALA